jgi:hypothetical protein
MFQMYPVVVGDRGAELTIAEVQFPGPASGGQGRPVRGAISRVEVPCLPNDQDPTVEWNSCHGSRS